MTTMNRLESMNVTVDFEIPVECLTYDDIKAMSREQRHELWKFASDNYDEYSDLYWLVDEVDHDIFFEENIAQFREYESHMGEEDFDWGFYSDWHKDFFGFRPRFKVIPKDDNERRRLNEMWHRDRGL